MKKLLLFTVIIAMLTILAGCSKPAIDQTIDNSFKPYHHLTDGSWQCDGFDYKYRLVIRGRIPGAVCDSEFVYLSNLPEISFDRAWKAAGLSSDTRDYFSPRDAVLVELN